MRKKFGAHNYFLYFFFLAITTFNLIIILPIIKRIRPHPDEHQFLLNAFQIMAGEELHNYLHVALTEYLLAGFYTLVNVFTDMGVNFPQGDPTLATYYYSHIFGFLLYIATFVLGVIIMQKGRSVLRLRSIIFAVLYFASLGLFERFHRVNSDSMMIFVFFNFLILSLWMYKIKASEWKFLVLNVTFVFLSSFTNLKCLYLILPLVFINFFVPIFILDKSGNKKTSLPKLYRILLAFGSWKVYLYDLLVSHITVPVVIAFIILLWLAKRYSDKEIFEKVSFSIRQQFKLKYFKEGNLYSVTEFILFLTLISYYIGVSSRVIHWSRWGAPLGIFSIMIMSSYSESWIKSLYKSKILSTKLLLSILLSLLIFVSLLKILFLVDLEKSKFPDKNGFNQTYDSINNYLDSKHVPEEDRTKVAAWFTGPTSNVGAMSIGDIGTGLPSFTSYYLHYARYFAAVLGLTWLSEIEDISEAEYGIVTLKDDYVSNRVSYDVTFKDMSHYHFPFSLIFNMRNLTDNYSFPPCYSYPDAIKESNGTYVLPPPEFGIGGRTAGLYCHSVRFRVFPIGLYRIQMENLPENVDDTQVVFSNMAGYEWDTVTNTLTFYNNELRYVGDFGIATKEKKVKDLKFRIFYSH